jgi:tetratricopeptide (TPR) repeat protein
MKIGQVFSLFLSLLVLTSLAFAQPAGQADADKGVELYKQRRYKESIQYIEKALKAGVATEQESDLWTIVGNGYDALEQYPQAIVAHEKALELDPQSFIAWTNLGATHRHNGNYPEARRCYQKALDINANYPEAHASLGALYIFEGEPEKAVASLEKALALDDSLPVTHANIAVAYAKLGRFAEAQTSLDKATSLGYRNTAVIQGMIDDEKANNQ